MRSAARSPVSRSAVQNASRLPTSRVTTAGAKRALSSEKSPGPSGTSKGTARPSGPTTIGAGCPARATVQVRANGSYTPYRQPALSGSRWRTSAGGRLSRSSARRSAVSLSRASTSSGSRSRSASAWMTVRNWPMTMAVCRPSPSTRPTTRAVRAPARAIVSYQQPLSRPGSSTCAVSTAACSRAACGSSRRWTVEAMTCSRSKRRALSMARAARVAAAMARVTSSSSKGSASPHR